MDRSLPGFSVHGILQERILEWVATSSSSDKVRSEQSKWSEVTQSCSTLCDPMDCSLPGSSIHGFSRQEDWFGWYFLLQCITLVCYFMEKKNIFIPFFFSLLFTFLKMYCLWWAVTCCMKKNKKTSVLSVWRVLPLILTFYVYSCNNIQEVLIKL